MKIVIIGCGKVGRAILKTLAVEGHDIVVLDSKDSVLQKVSGKYDVLPLMENGVSPDSQRQAGVETCDLVIATTSSDEKNILCCMTAKKLGAKRTIARVRNPEYGEQLRFLKDELGLSLSVNPEYTLADELYKMLRFPSAINVDSFSKDKVELAEIRVPENGMLVGVPLSEINQKFKTSFLICAIERDGELIIPRGNFVIHANDKLHVTVADDKLNEFFKEVGIYKVRPRKIMIVGGGIATHYLAEQLHKVGLQIKIIEKDAEKAEKLAADIPYVSVTIGNGTSEELLVEEGLDDTDAFLALTDNDETNSILALYAQQRGVDKVITKISHKIVGGMFDKIGLDSIVSPEKVTADKIVRFVRSLSSARGDEVVSLYKLFEGQGEAVEFRAHSGSKIINTPLKDIKTKEDIIIASIEHNGKISLPNGNSEIHEGDTVVVVAKHQYFDCLDDIADE